MGEAANMFLNLTTNISIVFKNENEITLHEFKINGLNANEVQQKKLITIPQNVQVNAYGTGIAFAAISCDYSEKAHEKAKEGNFELRLGVDLSKNGQIITIYISTRAMTENKDSDIKGMTLAEVELPSGFEFRNMTQMYEELKGYGVKVSLFSIYRFHFIKNLSSLQKVEFTNEKTIAVLYFDPLSNSTQSFNVKGYQVFDVLNLKSASVQVYSYTAKGEMLNSKQ